MNSKHSLRNRLISGLLTAVLALGIMPIPAFAEEAVPVTTQDTPVETVTLEALRAGVPMWSEPFEFSVFDTPSDPLPAPIANSVYSGKYYDQLDAIGKSAYDYILQNPVISAEESQANPLIFSEGIIVDAVVVEDAEGNVGLDFQNDPKFSALKNTWTQAVIAVSYDHPMCSWITSRFAGSFLMRPASDMDEVEVGDTVQILLYGTYYGFLKPSFYEELSSPDLEAKIQAVVNKVDTSASRLEQLKTLHDEICNLTSYNYEAAANHPGNNPEWLFAWSPYALFNGEKVICESYARSLKILCDRVGIPCAIISGRGGNESHMWNAVKMEDGKWYYVDATWDDDNSEQIVYTYFLKSSGS